MTEQDSGWGNRENLFIILIKIETLLQIYKHVILIFALLLTMSLEGCEIMTHVMLLGSGRNSANVIFPVECIFTSAARRAERRLYQDIEVESSSCTPPVVFSFIFLEEHLFRGSKEMFLSRDLISISSWSTRFIHPRPH